MTLAMKQPWKIWIKCAYWGWLGWGIYFLMSVYSDEVIVPYNDPNIFSFKYLHLIFFQSRCMPQYHANIFFTSDRVEGGEFNICLIKFEQFWWDILLFLLSSWILYMIRFHKKINVNIPRSLIYRSFIISIGELAIFRFFFHFVAAH